VKSFTAIKKRENIYNNSRKLNWTSNRLLTCRL
jgi:hypothetical protein